MKTLPERIIEEARGWIGTPYHRRQHARGKGTDCLNFAGGVFHALGILTTVPYRDYRGRWWERGNLIMDAIAEATADLAPGYTSRYLIAGEAVEPGDLLLGTSMDRCDIPTHVAFVEAIEWWGLTVIHAREGRGGQVERTRMPPAWRVLWVMRVEEVPHG